jgi:hypothetical protein
LTILNSRSNPSSGWLSLLAKFRPLAQDRAP